MKKPIAWIPQLAASAILVMAALPKLTGAEESVALFTALGMEPAGRFITGVLEITAALLLLLPNSAVYGAILAAGVMCGALIAHLTRIGVTGEMGSMFGLALLVLLCSLAVIYLRRRELPLIKHMFTRNS